MNITSATGHTNQLQSTDAEVLAGGTGIATVGIRKHKTTPVEEVTEAAAQKIEAARTQSLGSTLINVVG